MRRQERVAARLKALFLAGDANGDGCLTYEEIALIVASVDRTRKEAEVVRMFRESLQVRPVWGGVSGLGISWRISLLVSSRLSLSVAAPLLRDLTASRPSS